MTKLLISSLISFALGAYAAQSTFQPVGAPFKAPVTVAPGYVASVLFSNLTSPRGIAIDSKSHLLVVERGVGVTALSHNPGPPEGWRRVVVLEDKTLTQGIQVDGDKLYVSNASAAFVYTYNATSKSVKGKASTVVFGLPADGELTTHTLQLEKSGTKSTALLIGSGPLTNIDLTARDPASGRSQIRRFVLGSTPQSWTSGQVLAYGIRNPAGFAYSIKPSNTTGSTDLYVVENGASINNVTGLTAKFVNDNPADELERVTFAPGSGTPRSYGFPDCTTLWNPKADPVGVPQYANLTKGAQFSLNLNTTRDDAWCRNTTNNVPPAVSFQAHSVPLDIKIFDPKVIRSGSFDIQYIGDAFVTFHGSFDRTPPTGYGVVRVPFVQSAGVPNTTAPYEYLIQAVNLTSCPGNCIRPVGLAFGANDAFLYVTSDSSGEVFVIKTPPT